MQSIQADRMLVGSSTALEELRDEPAVPPTASALPTGAPAMAPSKDVISPKLDSREEGLEGLPGPIVKLLVEPYKLSYWYFELFELARKVASPHAQSVPRPLVCT